MVPVLHNVMLGRADADAIRGALAAQAASPVRGSKHRAFAAQGVTHLSSAGGQGADRSDQAHCARPHALPLHDEAAIADGSRPLRKEPRCGNALRTDRTRYRRHAGHRQAIALALARPGASVAGTATTDDGAAAINGILSYAGHRGEAFVST